VRQGICILSNHTVIFKKINYKINLTYIYSLTGHVISLDFIHFEVEKNFECSYDYLEMREGLDGGGNLIGRLCGGGQAGTIESGSNLWLNFRSDTSVTSSGFLVKYTIRSMWFLVNY
jgi:cubilin